VKRRLILPNFPVLSREELRCIHLGVKWLCGKGSSIRKAPTRLPRPLGLSHLSNRVSDFYILSSSLSPLTVKEDRPFAACPYPGSLSHSTPLQLNSERLAGCLDYRISLIS
jgi:hypothetical protein